MIHKGLDSILVNESSICLIDGERSRLYYRGYSIDDLADKSSYEEVAYLLIIGQLPTKFQLDEFKATLFRESPLSQITMALLKSYPSNSHPMDVLRTTISSLALEDAGLTQDKTINLQRAIRILAKAPVIISAFERIRQGKEPLSPKKELGHAANFLYMVHGDVPSTYDVKVMDTALSLHAEHEMNASTFSGIVTASTLSDMYSIITAGIATLRGSLHGGANEEALKMIIEVGSPENAVRFVEERLKQKKRIMGFGHRIYKTYDPRYTVLKSIAEKLGAVKGKEILYDTAVRVEREALEHLSDSKIFPNVDFYSGLVFHMLGFRTDLFTPIFASSRIAGWSAHVLEYLEDNRLIRPKAAYIGEVDLRFIPIEQRA
ncbi:MAG: citrate synthase/methylcitrate synthase [Thaumarchaeota archaeon]|nr:citrate synthase/methylcitrate synthase [Nitrososphaerota archaeon]